FAVPTSEHYTPGIGVSIDADTGAIIAGDEARVLHNAQNRGPMLSIGYWCEGGCQGHIELRQHKGHLFASLHTAAPTVVVGLRVGFPTQVRDFQSRGTGLVPG